MHSEKDSNSGYLSRAWAYAKESVTGWTGIKLGTAALAGIGAGLTLNAARYGISNALELTKTIDIVANSVSQGIKHTGLDIANFFLKNNLVPNEYIGLLIVAGLGLGVTAFAFSHSGETGKQFHRHLWKTAAAATVSTLGVAVLGPVVGLPAVAAFKIAAGMATSAAVYNGLGFLENTATRAMNWYRGAPKTTSAPSLG